MILRKCVWSIVKSGCFVPRNNINVSNLLCRRYSSGQPEDALQGYPGSEDDDIDLQYNNNQLDSSEPRLQPPHTGTLFRIIPKTREEVEALRRMPVQQPHNPRFLRVSLLGMPNAGKSSLVNQLMSWRVCSTSKKVHTTRKQSKVIMVEGSTQVVFFDTPGLVGRADCKRHRLDKSLLMDPINSLEDADIIAVIVDSTNKWTRHKLDPKLVFLLDRFKHKPSVLILNKVDALKSKQILLETIRSVTKGIVDGYQSSHPYVQKPRGKNDRIDIEELFRKMEKAQAGTGDLETDRNFVEDGSEDGVVEAESISEEAKDLVITYPSQTIEEFVDPYSTIALYQDRSTWTGFDNVFMVSAATGDGVRDLKNFFLDRAQPGHWLYNPHFVTDQTPRDIVLMAIREKLMEHLQSQVPYILKLGLTMWEVDEHGVLRLSVNVATGKKNKYLMKQVIGPRGDTIRAVGVEARQELMNTFRCEVSLKLIVAV